MSRQTPVDETSERLLLRLVLDELEPAAARALRARLTREPELMARHARLEALWRGLELETATVPTGFRRAVLERVASSEGGELRWSLAPFWARAGAVAALVVGLVLGTGLGRAVVDAPLEASWPDSPPSLAERYWQTLETNGGRLEPGEPPR